MNSLFVLTQKRKLAVLFSIYVSTLFLLLCGIFLLLFRVISLAQMQKDFVRETGEIIANHLSGVNQTLQFVTDETGTSLREYLLTENMSAMFLNAQGEVVRAYGIFSVDDQGKTTPKVVQEALPVILQGNTAQDLRITWKQQPVMIHAIPLKQEGFTYGVMVLGRSLEQVNSLTTVIVLVFGIVGLLNLVMSFVVGLLLSTRAFRPFHKIMKTVEHLDLDNIRQHIAITGHPKDEAVVLANRMNEMMQRLGEMADRQKAFVSQASHELKTPLTRIISSLEVMRLKTHTLPPEIQDVIRELFHMSTLIDDLLLLSSLRPKSVRALRAKTLPLKRLFFEIQQTFQEHIEKKQLQVTLNVPETMTTYVPGKYARVLFTNIFSNAVKYNKLKGSIVVSGKADNRGTTVSCKDTGSGVAQSDLAHVFDRFFRGSHEKSQVRGHGIGLSIVKHICDVFYLPIKFRSTFHQGSEVEVILPNTLST